jgi:L-lysine 2,3-aminomutase
MAADGNEGARNVNRPETYDEFIALLESGDLDDPDRPVLRLDVTSKWTPEDFEAAANDCRGRASASPDRRLQQRYENMAGWLHQRAKHKRAA